MSYYQLRDGTRIRYSLRGAGSQTYVLVHGWKQSHRLYDRVVHILSQEARVLTFDQRGMGESDKPDCNYDFSTLASDLGELITEFGISDCTLLGWSMGCTTSLTYLSQSGKGISRVALLNGPLRLTKSSDFSHALTEDELDRYISDMEREWPKHELLFYEQSLLPRHSYMAPLLLSVGLQTPLDVALKLVKNQSLIDHTETIRKIDVPILALYSAFDPYWPIDLGKWIESNGKHARLHILNDSAHCAPLEEPENLVGHLRDFARV
jgi:non-heme chloroperoxidase